MIITTVCDNYIHSMFNQFQEYLLGFVELNPVVFYTTQSSQSHV